jgi:hypothetical protein
VLFQEWNHKTERGPANSGRGRGAQHAVSPHEDTERAAREGLVAPESARDELHRMLPGVLEHVGR